MKKLEDIVLGQDVTLDTNRLTIAVQSKMELNTLYSFMKELWYEHPTYIKFYFPMQTFKDVWGNVHVAMINGWSIVGIENIKKPKK